MAKVLQHLPNYARDVLLVCSNQCYSPCCWGSRLRVAEANRLNKLTSNVAGMELDSLTVSWRRTLSKLGNVFYLPSTCHPQEEEDKTHPFVMYQRASQELVPACGHPTPQLLQKLPVNRISPDYLFHISCYTLYQHYPFTLLHLSLHTLYIFLRVLPFVFFHVFFL